MSISFFIVLILGGVIMLRKESTENIFKIQKNKTIPILKDYISNLPTTNNLFDEEIIFNNNDEIYVDNRIRIVIHQEGDYILIYDASFQEAGGLCYGEISMTNEEFKQFGTVENLIQKIYIEGCYSDRGVSVATGKTKEDFIDKDITEDMF